MRMEADSLVLLKQHFQHVLEQGVEAQAISSLAHDS